MRRFGLIDIFGWTALYAVWFAIWPWSGIGPWILLVWSLLIAGTIAFKKLYSTLTDKMEFEKAFRVVFSAMDNLEDFMRYSRYPNVTIHPIAVYRSFKSQQTSD
jgi:hypothetical protein